MLALLSMPCFHGIAVESGFGAVVVGSGATGAIMMVAPLTSPDLAMKENAGGAALGCARRVYGAAVRVHVGLRPRPLLEEAVDVVLLDVGQDVEEQRVQTPAVRGTGAQVGQGRQLALVGIVVVVHGQGNLLE